MGQGTSQLLHAAATGELDLLSRLLDQGVDVNAAEEVSMSGFCSILSLLETHTTDAKTQIQRNQFHELESSECCQGSQWTALHHASWGGHEKVVRQEYLPILKTFPTFMS